MLDPGLELTANPAWGEDCREEALVHTAPVDRHLSDGRDWLGGDASTFSDITLAAAIAFSKFKVNVMPLLDERYGHIDAFWQRWQGRPTFSPPIPTETVACPNSTTGRLLSG